MICFPKVKVKMDGQVEGSFDLLRAWEITNLYEKAYFLSVHALLLFLGIYSIRKRACSSRARPPSTTGIRSEDDHVAQKDARYPSKVRSHDAKDVIWANKLARWLLQNCTCYAKDTFDAWRLKMNGRLLSSTSDAKVQIEDIDKDSFRFEVKDITSEQPPTNNQINIMVKCHVEELRMQIQFTQADQPSLTTQLKLQSVMPLLHIKLVNVNSKPKSYLSIDGFSVDDKNIVLGSELETCHIEMIKSAFRRSFQSSVSLETTRGILKKELKIEVKSKETQAKDEQSEETQRHIFVTDLDSAIAKVASEGANMRRAVITKRNHPESKIVIPQRQLGIAPDIKVQPATPLDSDDDFQNAFIPKTFVKSDKVPCYLSLGEGETKILENPDECRTSEKTDSDTTSVDDVKVKECESASVENAKSDEINESSGLVDDVAEENLVENDVTHLKELACKSVEQTPVLVLEEKQDKPSPSPKESSRDVRRRPRPRSLYDIDNEDHDFKGDLTNLDTEPSSYEKKAKSELGRVNTFHFGSKSMISIATTPKRSNSAILKAAASQWSLTSPVGYSPSKPSALIIESEELGKKRYFHVPPAVARKGTYEQNGLKLHVYNGHLFVAQHFAKPLPTCAVCSLPLSWRMGKQGYQCRDCKTITHKRCHTLINHICETSSFPSLTIEYPWSTDV